MIWQIPQPVIAGHPPETRRTDRAAENANTLCGRLQCYQHFARHYAPIIAKPQVAILGVHKVVEKPVVVDGEIVIRPIMNFGLSFDHRVIDGAYAVRFLRRLIEYLEEPDSWILDAV